MVDRHVDGRRHVQHATQPKLDALCSDIAAHLDTAESAGGVRPEGDEVSYRSRTDRTTGGRPDWGGRPRWGRRTISNTRFFPKSGGW